MIAAGEIYRPPQGVDATSVVMACVGATVAAAAAAAIPSVWSHPGLLEHPEMWGHPSAIAGAGLPDTFVGKYLATSAVAQGVFLGLALSLVYRGSKLRSLDAAAYIAIAFALISVLLVHVHSYVNFVNERHEIAERQYQVAVHENDTSSIAETREYMEAPFMMASREMKNTVGVSGFAGYMIRASKAGLALSTMTSPHRVPLRGQGVYVYWGLNAAAVVALSVFLAEPRIYRPYCGDCKLFYKRPFTALELSMGGVGFLTMIVAKGDVARLVALFPVDRVDPKSESARIQLHVCPKCDSSLAEVVVRRRRRGVMRDEQVMPLTGISKQLTYALRVGPALVPGDAPAAMGGMAAGQEGPKVRRPSRDIGGGARPSRDIGARPSRGTAGIAQSSLDVAGAARPSRDTAGAPQQGRDIGGAPGASRDVGGS